MMAQAPRTPKLGGSFYVETYGCQMNTADTEIVHAVLEGGGMTRTLDIQAADVILVNTCAIRENAEDKVRPASVAAVELPLCV